jgi:hypothetical protein
MFHVDSLNVNKEKKTFFNKVEETDEYFPFGSPGGGAPLRNSNNDLVSKLPNINENLWSRYAKNEQNDINHLQKKQEIHQLIDSYVQPAPSMFQMTNNQSDQIVQERRLRYQHLDPHSRSHIKPDSYWNDWFGRPGAGAPNQYYHKQNLSEMLEPRRKIALHKSIDRYEPYIPTINEYASNPTSPRRFKSNHHNRYEISER